MKLKVVKSFKFRINCEMGIWHQDEKPFRGYWLEANGDELDELLDNAMIQEIGAQGQEYDTYRLVDAKEEIRAKALRLIGKFISAKAEAEAYSNALEVVRSL